MNKYDTMIATNQANSRAKVTKAKTEISQMVSDNVQVTIGDLVRRTGLSRAFFYKNKEVAKAVEQAREMQDGKALTRPQKVILDKAMDKQLRVLEMQLEKLKNENSALANENSNLQKALKKKDLNFIKSL